MPSSLAVAADQAQTTLNKTFGLDAFRPGQREVIDRVLAGRNSLAVFPTGGGKSLCYQLPAILQKNLTLVVSPLLALMREQVDFLRSRGIAAGRLDSSLDASEYADTLQQLRRGELKLLYVAPERLFNERFRETIRSLPIDLLVIDEVHCISQWGHNFRPDYLRLADAVRRYDIRTVLGLTATATQTVADDIRQVFAIAAEDEIRTPFRRENLAIRFTACSSSSRMRLLAQALAANPGPAIVYTTLQRTSEEVAARLVEMGFDAVSYHAGLEDSDRRAIQDSFMQSDQQIVVATIAFGMGIDKANVRAVIHYNVSNGLENYAQEIGRAGRDGEPSVCQTLCVADDRTVVENFAYGDTPDPDAVRDLVRFIAGQSEEFYVSYYGLGYDFDIRDTVLRTALTYLELDGYLQAVGPRYDAYQIKFLQPMEAIAAKFDGERRQFVESIFQLAVRKKKWTELNMPVAQLRLGQPRSRIVAMLDYFAEKGFVELKPSVLMNGYRRLAAIADPDKLAESLVERLSKLETAGVRRVAQLMELAASSDCQAAVLASHFGDRDSSRCGKCSACTAQPVDAASLVDSGGGIGSSVLTQLRPLLVKHADALESPRQIARFLCGISSPRTVRHRLTRHELFGCCSHLTLPGCMAQIEGKLA